MSHEWKYKAPKKKQSEQIPEERNEKKQQNDQTSQPNPSSLPNLGFYYRKEVSNLDYEIPAITKNKEASSKTTARDYFNQGLLYYFGYQHEESIKCFLKCLELAPDCLLAHGLISLCHAPNYNFNGITYYNSTNHDDAIEQQQLVQLEGGDEEIEKVVVDHHTYFPSQQIASLHSSIAMTKMKKKQCINQYHKCRYSDNNSTSSGSLSPRNKNSSNNNDNTTKSNNNKKAISEKEYDILKAIAVLTSYPGIQPELAEETVGRPFANSLKKLYDRYPNDADVTYFYAESLMVLNAWNLYEYPLGTPKTPDVLEVQRVLDTALQEHPNHPGLCHLYVHLCEMSSRPDVALDACMVLRQIPDLGHLIHMATHLDVLVGDYVSCIFYNILAIEADMKLYKSNPDTSGPLSFYFGYVVHNFHMLVYGAILGGMEQVALQNIFYLNSILNEELFEENPELTVYLESYSAMEIHVMVRFGRWEKILEIDFPKNSTLMFFRTATLRFARALSYVQLGHIEEGKEESNLFEKFCNDHTTIANEHILHNNSIGSLLEVDKIMLRGEIAYREKSYDESFKLLRLAVSLQDSLHYDEPWGQMQPVRHSLGGLLLEKGMTNEAEGVFREDLKYHPKNPWSLYGLMRCLECDFDSSSNCCGGADLNKNNRVLEVQDELDNLRLQFQEQRKSKWVDFEIAAPCMCCEQKKLNL